MANQRKRKPAKKAKKDGKELTDKQLDQAAGGQQQTLQTISNVSKMLHDTAMAFKETDPKKLNP